MADDTPRPSLFAEGDIEEDEDEDGHDVSSVSTVSTLVCDDESEADDNDDYDDATMSYSTTIMEDGETTTMSHGCGYPFLSFGGSRQDDYKSSDSSNNRGSSSCSSVTGNVQDDLLLLAATRGDFPAVVKLIKDATRQNQLRRLNTQGVIMEKENIINEAVDEEGRTALHHVIRCGHPPVLVSYFVKLGAAVNQQDAHGCTPLHHAIQSPHRGMTLICLRKAGADANIGDARGETPLHYAVKRGGKSMVMTTEFLIDEMGANVNVRDAQGLTPLHIAVKQRNSHVVEKLLLKGANPNAASDDGTHSIPMDYLADYVGADFCNFSFLEIHQDGYLSNSNNFNLSREHLIARDLMLAGSFGPKHLFKTLFHAGWIFKQVDVWFERMAHSLQNIHDCKLFCTIVSIGVKLGLLSNEQATHVTTLSLQTSLSFCQTKEACDTLIAAMEHAERHERLAIPRKEFIRQVNKREKVAAIETPTIHQYLRDVFADDTNSSLDYLTAFRDACLKTRYPDTNPEITTQDNNEMLARAMASLVGAVVKSLIQNKDGAFCTQSIEVLNIPPPGPWTMVDSSFDAVVRNEIRKGETLILQPHVPIDENLTLGICAGALKAVEYCHQSWKSPLHWMCADDCFCPDACFCPDDCFCPDYLVKQAAVKYPALLHSRDKDGQLPLHLLCMNKSAHTKGHKIVSTVDILIGENYQECVGTTDLIGLTALHSACLVAAPSFPIIDAICKRFPAAVTMKDAHGFLPIHLACMQESVSRQVINRLIPSYYSGVSLQQPMMGPSSVRRPWCEISTTRYAREDLTFGGARTNVVSFGSRHSFVASRHGLHSVDTNRRGAGRLDDGAQVNQNPIDMRDFPNPIHLALQAGVEEDDVLALLEEELPECVITDIHLSSKEEDSFPLHKAVKYGDKQRLLEIISAGIVDVNAIDSRGRSALDLAASMGQRSLFDELFLHGAKSARFDSVTTLRRLAKHRKRGFRQSGNGLTPNRVNGGRNSSRIHDAIWHDDNDKFRFELSSLSRERMNNEDRMGRTPLDIAALRGRQHFFDTLWEKGARPSRLHSAKVLNAMLKGMKVKLDDEEKSRKSRSSSGSSRKSGRERIEKATWIFRDALLSKDDESNLPLHKIVKYGNLDALENALVQSRPDLTALDSEGRSVLDLACLSGQREAFERLRIEGAQPRKFQNCEEAILGLREPNVDLYLWMVHLRAAEEGIVANTVVAPPPEIPTLVLGLTVEDDASAISNMS